MGPNFNDVKVNKIIIVILISSIHTTIMIIVKSNFTINCLSLSLPPVLKRNCSRFFKVCVGLCNNAVLLKKFEWENSKGFWFTILGNWVAHISMD